MLVVVPSGLLKGVRRFVLVGLLAAVVTACLAACADESQSESPGQSTQLPVASPTGIETPVSIDTPAGVPTPTPDSTDEPTPASSDTPIPEPAPTSVPTPKPIPTDTPTPASSDTSTAEPTPTSPATPTPTLQGAGHDLSLLVVSVVYVTPEYDRAEWQHWIDDDGDCQDTRQEVLIEEATSSITYTDSRQCRVASGTWIGPYTGEEFTDPGRLDIDHMVPLANAHKSGGWAWGEAEKRQYANDLSYDGHLIAVQASANRSKGSKGPEDWKPPDRGYWCQYAIDWITVKARWDLFASEAEADSLSAMLESCVPALTLTVIQHDIPQPEDTPTTTPTPAAEGGETNDALEMYDDNGNGHISCAEARNHAIAPVRRGHPAYQYMNDADNDGVVCE